MGFLHHAFYFTYFEIGRTELLRACGGNYRRMEEEGLLVVVVRAECRFHRPARLRRRATAADDRRADHAGENRARIPALPRRGTVGRGQRDARGDRPPRQRATRARGATGQLGAVTDRIAHSGDRVSTPFARSSGRATQSVNLFRSIALAHQCDGVAGHGTFFVKPVTLLLEEKPGGPRPR